MAELACESERGRRLLPPIEETGRRGISGRSPVAFKFKLERRPTIINRIKQYLSPPTPKELPYQSYKHIIDLQYF